MMATPPEVVAPLSAVSLKLPPFWPHDPTIWFAQVDAQFQTRQITTQATKFAYVVSSLQPEIAQEVRDLLISPPTVDQYDKLKMELIKRTSESEQKRLHQLLISEELGDRKPSQLLRRMKQLLGENTLEERILRQLFLQRLPQNVQLILASSSDTVDLEQLAIIADKILEVASPPTVVTSTTVNAVSSSKSLEKRIDELQSQVSDLTTLVHELVMKGTSKGKRDFSRGRSRERTKNKSIDDRRSPSKSKSVPRAGSDCWYHWRFGDKATKCVKPCSYSETKSKATNQEN
ncbi:uncharacterized protein LOC110985394 [Acanthaster planci]|uniref:Uncharacterized protein LOC110985394 n=1 Tax=Acanthaster planci TaxID=133434 RepID=A0A8B7ZFR3_ACAPL|nr:uncharacterized protein LOC110985394 [Acanthaster planci]